MPISVSITEKNTAIIIINFNDNYFFVSIKIVFFENFTEICLVIYLFSSAIDKSLLDYNKVALLASNFIRESSL